MLAAPSDADASAARGFVVGRAVVGATGVATGWIGGAMGVAIGPAVTVGGGGVVVVAVVVATSVVCE